MTKLKVTKLIYILAVHKYICIYVWPDLQLMQLRFTVCLCRITNCTFALPQRN